MQTHEYYQIFVKEHPLIDGCFQTKREARSYLKKIALEIDKKNGSPFLFTTYVRRLPNLPIRDILFLKQIYADGHEEPLSLVIRHIKYIPTTIKF